MSKPTKRQPVPVLVRFFSGEESNPLLLFLTEPADSAGYLCQSWQPVGEHGAASLPTLTAPAPGKMRGAATYPATRAEAEAALARYIRSYPADSHPPEGYRVVMRENPAHREARMAEARRLRRAA